MAKFIHAASLAGFKKAYTGWASDTSDVYTSIALTDDGYLVTHGKTFITANSDNNFPYPITLGGASGSLTVTIKGSSGSIQLSGLGLTAGGTNGVNPTLTLDHTKTLSEATSVGNNGTIIEIPTISSDIYGHITALSSVDQHVDYVTQTATAVNATYNLLFSSAVGTSEIYFSTTSNKPITYNPSSGTLSTPALNVGGASIDSLIRGTKATAADFGVVKLIDTLDTGTETNNKGASTSIAASQLALYNAYKAAIDYADQKITAAVSFKGTLGTGGTITALPTTGYTIGDEYRVITVGTYAGNICEVGDMIIATKSYVTGAVAANDWAVIQNNLVGALQTNGSSIQTNGIVVGLNNGYVSNITVPSTTNSFLKWNGTAYTWDTNIYRTLQINGTQQLSSSTSTTINVANGTNTTVSYDNGKIQINSSYVNTTYKLLSGAANSTANATTDNTNTYLRLLTTANADAGSLQIKGTGKTSISSTGGVISIDSSWRTVKYYDLTQTVTSLTSDLLFSKSFALNTSSEIDIVWAEVTEDANGNTSISYKV